MSSVCQCITITLIMHLFEMTPGYKSKLLLTVRYS